jgi:hypothetical protein
LKFHYWRRFFAEKIIIFLQCWLKVKKINQFASIHNIFEQTTKTLTYFLITKTICLKQESHHDVRCT